MWRYDNLCQVQLGLLEKNIIDLQGEVEPKMALYVREALNRLRIKGSPDITIQITSNGGDVTVGLDIFDLLKNYPGKKTGIVFSFAKSMAAVILQACTDRLAYEFSDILIHHVNTSRITLDELRDKRKLKKIKETAEMHQEKLYRILMERTGKTKKEIMKTCALDTNMSSQESLDFGLIDKIL